MFLAASVIIGGAFVYFYWYSKKKNVRWYLRNNNVRIEFNPNYTKNKLLNAILLNI